MGCGAPRPRTSPKAASTSKNCSTSGCIRKATGARKSDIRAQFLIEAITLSGIGGVIGILIGGGISLTLRAGAGIPAVVSPFWVIMGVGISVGVGLFFGYYPANRAANLDPIVCLRYE